MNIIEYNIDPPNYDTVEIECPDCGGSGKQNDVKNWEGQMVFHEDCLCCGGDGIIVVDASARRRIMEYYE